MDGRHEGISRRDAMRLAGTVAAASMVDGSAVLAAERAVVNGRINQSVSEWCYSRWMKLDQLCENAKQIGLKGIDLLGPAAFPTLKKYDLVCTMVNSYGINPGLNKKENHERCLASLRKAIEATAEAGYPNVICMSGNREPGLTDEEGAKNCVDALKQIAGFAEEKKITLCMELLNSKRDHRGYMCDRTEWGVNVCKAVGSERVKLLYDIYHMQIQEGDVIATIRKYKDYIGHYHTGGVPGRNEIDDTQELYYPAIMKAIADSGYKGYVAHEFIPRRDPMTSLAQAAKLCDV